ncbi:MAG: HAMP domain-containing sensor histidine kinase [Thermoanaerobaculales bacterium]|jgi:signal transduction histidine kinase|nr:HAMP domain-containing sensor histidine kinase [Thermoanaerobaculales bacterium]
MKLQTRLFLGTAVLVLTLVAVQWWLHLRQLRIVEGQLGEVAASVGKDILQAGPRIRVFRPDDHEGEVYWFENDGATGDELGVQVHEDVMVTLVPDGEDGDAARRVTRRTVRLTPEDGVESNIEVRAEVIKMDVDGDLDVISDVLEGEAGHRYVLQVAVDEEANDRVLLIHGDAGQLERIPIPVEPALESFETSMRRGAAVGGLLLLVGLVGAGVLANRVTRPLRGLADGAEAVGRGELGIQVPETAAGEVGELQRSFNAMSSRLAELEAERDRWREREHLAQLGDVSRGLAHTLRNPLNTLGLAVEELASDGRGRGDLVVTARSQIRRIDRWLRSFLALGAEDVAEPALEDLGDMTRAVVFEAVQQGAAVELDDGGEPAPVTVVGTAVRAALENLVDNAVAVSPADAPVEVAVTCSGKVAAVAVSDRGPGLPDEVRARLFEPHVTTKVGGSGMGLFLARQLVVGMHGGVLEVEDRPGGGTIAVVKLPLSTSEEAPGA